jgi:hypothetical protein
VPSALSYNPVVSAAPARLSTPVRSGAPEIEQHILRAFSRKTRATNRARLVILRRIAIFVCVVLPGLALVRICGR